MATYILKENEARNDETALMTDITEILSKRGISVSQEMIPSDSIVLSSVVVKKEGGEKAVAERLFGDVTESVEEKNTVYSSPKGNIMFSGESFSLVYESGREIDGAEAATKATQYANTIVMEMQQITGTRYRYTLTNAADPRG